MPDMDKKGKLAFSAIFASLSVFWVVWSSAAKGFDEWQAHRDLAKALAAGFVDIIQNPVSLGVVALVALCGYVCRDDLLVLWHQFVPPPKPPDEPKASFTARPIGASTLLVLPGTDLIARLAITNVSPQLQRNCSVRLLGAYRLRNGGLWSESGMFPSVNQQRGEGFLLRWGRSETATADGKYLNIPPDGSERIADCLIVDQSPNRCGRALFCAANPDDLPALKGISGGWWKLCIRVSSENGDRKDIDLVAACGFDPGPITLDPWLPRGEMILAEQAAEIDDRKTPPVETAQPTDPKLEIVYEPGQHFTPRGDISQCRFSVRNSGQSRASRVKVKLESLVPLTHAEDTRPYSTQFNDVLLQVVRERPWFPLNAGEGAEILLLTAYKRQEFFAVKGHNVNNEPKDLETPRADYELNVVASAMNSLPARATFIVTNTDDGGITFRLKGDSHLATRFDP